MATWSIDSVQCTLANATLFCGAFIAVRDWPREILCESFPGAISVSDNIRQSLRVSHCHFAALVAPRKQRTLACIMTTMSRSLERESEIQSDTSNRIPCESVAIQFANWINMGKLKALLVVPVPLVAGSLSLGLLNCRCPCWQLCWPTHTRAPATMATKFFPIGDICAWTSSEKWNDQSDFLAAIPTQAQRSIQLNLTSSPATSSFTCLPVWSLRVGANTIVSRSVFTRNSAASIGVRNVSRPERSRGAVCSLRWRLVCCWMARLKVGRLAEWFAKQTSTTLERASVTRSKRTCSTLSIKLLATLFFNLRRLHQSD